MIYTDIFITLVVHVHSCFFKTFKWNGSMNKNKTMDCYFRRKNKSFKYWNSLNWKVKRTIVVTNQVCVFDKKILDTGAFVFFMDSTSEYKAVLLVIAFNFINKAIWFINYLHYCQKKKLGRCVITILSTCFYFEK